MSIRPKSKTLSLVLDDEFETIRLDGNLTWLVSIGIYLLSEVNNRLVECLSVDVFIYAILPTKIFGIDMRVAYHQFPTKKVVISRESLSNNEDNLGLA